MQVTHVRVRKLRTGQGYNNNAVELEAALDPGEAVEEVTAALGILVDRELARFEDRETVLATTERLQRDVEYLTDVESRLRERIEGARQVVGKYDGLAELAAKLGVESGKELDDGRPF